jgi:putative ABC transport system ATP-binding protein
MENEPFIRCEGLVKTFKVANLEVVALQGLDLVIQRGELVGITGPSGSGKTALLNVLGGLDLPAAGQVWVDGIDLLKISPAALDRYRSTRVGFIWQQGARNLVPNLSALDNVRLPVALLGHAQANASQRAAELLESVGLAERRHQRLEELSSGDQQRVAIAVALSNDPFLLLADEPAGELDSVTAANIYRVFADLNQQLGLTTIIASRDPVIARFVQRTVGLSEGRTAADTPHSPAQPAAQHSLPGTGAPTAAGETYQEVVLLDAAGRLQIPSDYLEHFNIRGQARVELTEDGILIAPPGPRVTRPAPAATPVPPPSAAPAGLQGIWDRLRGRNRP